MINKITPTPKLFHVSTNASLGVVPHTKATFTTVGNEGVDNDLDIMSHQLDVLLTSAEQMGVIIAEPNDKLATIAKRSTQIQKDMCNFITSTKSTI